MKSWQKNPSKKRKLPSFNKIPLFGNLVVERLQAMDCDKLGMKNIHQQDVPELRKARYDGKERGIKKGCGQ